MIGAAYRIEVGWGEGAASVRAFAPAPTPIAALLRGKTPEAALGLIPLIYNLCASAQEAAARAALGLARERDEGRRIAAETLREHALRCLKDYPEALGLEPNLAALAGIARLDCPGADALIDGIETALFGPSGAAALDAAEAFVAEGASVSARALGVMAEWPAAWGADPEAGAPCMDPTLLRRVAADPRLAPVLAARGASLFTRLLARLVDAARMIEILRGERPPATAERLAPGVGAAEAARGRLIHRARVRTGTVRDYVIETPTDTVVGDGAMLSRMLSSAGLAPPALRARAARLAVLACDPCAPVNLEFAPFDAARAGVAPSARERLHA